MSTSYWKLIQNGSFVCHCHSQNVLTRDLLGSGICEPQALFVKAPH